MEAAADEVDGASIAEEEDGAAGDTAVDTVAVTAEDAVEGVDAAADTIPTIKPENNPPLKDTTER